MKKILFCLTLQPIMEQFEADYIPMFVGNHVENVVFSEGSRSTTVSQTPTR